MGIIKERAAQITEQSCHDKWNVKMYIHQKEHKSVYFWHVAMPKQPVFLIVSF